MSENRHCLQCGESQAAIKASQSTQDPIHCATEDYFGEINNEYPRHRFIARTKKDATTEPGEQP